MYAILEINLISFKIYAPYYIILNFIRFVIESINFFHIKFNTKLSVNGPYPGRNNQRGRFLHPSEFN